MYHKAFMRNVQWDRGHQTSNAWGSWQRIDYLFRAPDILLVFHLHHYQRSELRLNQQYLE